MPKLRRISGKSLVKLLCDQGFSVVRQKGSHVRLTLKKGGGECAITVPLHDEMDRGTLKAIARPLGQYLSKEVIRNIFYTD